MAAGAGALVGRGRRGREGSERARVPGPESPRPAGAWPGRGPGRGLGAAQARTTHWGKKKKSPIHRAGGGGLVAPAPFPARPGSGRGAGLGERPPGRSGARASPLLNRRPPPPSLGARTRALFPSAPLGTHRSPERRLPRLVLSSKVLGSRAGGAAEPALSAFRFPAPRLPGFPARIVATVQGAIIG